MQRAEASASIWRAHLHLRYGVDDIGRTALRARRHAGPLQVQRPFYPEPDGVCHSCILHPPGGVVGGDELEIDVSLDAKAQVVITTPAAGKFYRSAGATASQRQRLRVAPGACLEWLPQEAIFYDGARVRTITQVDLAADARFLGWEIVCLGRPASGERFATGDIGFGFELWREGRPLWLERGRIDPALLGARWGFDDQPVSGTLLCVVENDDALPALRALAAEEARLHGFAVTSTDGVVACRYLGPSVQAARTFFERAWSLLRPQLCGRAAHAPRVWQT
jgi:urease accessory protein